MINTAAAMTLAVLLMGGCVVALGPEPSAMPEPATPDPSSSASPMPSTPPASPAVAVASEATSTPTPIASPSPVVAPEPLRVDGLAKVVAEGLRVRSAPDVSADSELLDSLAPGRMLFVVDGPVAGSGYEWYLVAPIPDGEDYGDAWDPTWGDGESFDPGRPYRAIASPIGWVAGSSREGTPWVVGLRFGCPDPDSFSLGLSPLVALSCYGDTSLRLSLWGGFTAAESGRVETYSGEPGLPGWLMDHSLRRYWFPAGIVDPGEFFGTALDPASFPNGVPPTGSFEWNIVGHFDDDAARTCRPSGESHNPDDPSASVLMCRATFVITDIAPSPS